MRAAARAALALGLILALTGCGKRDDSIHISLSSWGDPKEYAILDELCRKFEQSNPGLKVDLQRVPFGEYNRKILAEFTAGTVPDIIFGGDGQITEFFPRKLLEPLNDFLKDDPDIRLSDYYL